MGKSADHPEDPEAAPAPPPTIIKIEPAQPQVVYVPTYNPTVVYGGWPYPAYPPYSYYPPGYVAATSVISFGVGMAVGAALWGGCSWGWGGGWGGHNDVNINVNRYNSFNHTNISNNNWQHNVDHRKGVQYRDNAIRQKYNRGTSGGVESREAFRGRAEQGRQDIARGAAKDYKTKPAVGKDAGARQPGANREKPGVGKGDGSRQAVANREKPAAGTKGGSRQPATNRPQPQPQRQSERSSAASNKGAAAFQGMGNGQQARADSNRGRTSRESAMVSTGTPSPMRKRAPSDLNSPAPGRRATRLPAQAPRITATTFASSPRRALPPPAVPTTTSRTAS